MACALAVAGLWISPALAASLENVSALIEARDFPKAAREIGSILNDSYPEARGDTVPCDRAVARGDLKVLHDACELDTAFINETPAELTNIVMGQMARGQFFVAAKAITTLHQVRPTEESAQLMAILAPAQRKTVSATQDDLVRGGPFAADSMAGFDHAIAAAEAGDWNGSCEELDHLAPAMPDYRNLHLLHFVVCAHGGVNRRVALADYGKIVDPRTKVFVALLLGEFPAAELDARLKAVSGAADSNPENLYYAAEAAFLAGDQAAYRKHLAQVAATPNAGLFEQRMAAAEARMN